MNPEQWQKVKEIFGAASQRAAGERADFLVAACDRDDEVRREVESLLSSFADAQSFMESPAVGEVASLIVGSHERLAAGHRIAHYEIIQSIGAGGMGAVYLAQDTQLQRKVAIKVLQANLTMKAEQVRRFWQEARAASALNHPHILTIHEVGLHEGVPYIVSEYVAGQTLRECLNGPALRLGKTLDIVVQIADALTAAHAVGIVHRDIKPENIMLRSDGYVKVLDFGLAKLIERQTAFANHDADAAPRMLVQTVPGMLMGTISYMSPEQVRGFAVDGRTDVWSLGVVLYQLLTGRAPFAGETTSDVMVAILTTDPVPPSTFAHEIPAEFDRIVSLTLAKNCEERFPSVKDLLAHLQQLKKRLEFEAHAGREFGSPPSGSLKSLQAEPPNADAETRIFKIQTRNSIAVLPFANLSSEAENEYFCDGLAEELLNALAKIADLQVTARSSAFSFKGKAANVSVIGRTLSVRTVLEGSVRKSGNRVRVTAQLINVENGYQLWSERYDREMQDIFEMQDEITLAIVEVLKVKLLREEKPAAVLKRPTKNIEAYQLYLKGRYYLNKWTPDGFKKSMECFNQAIEIDPNYAHAYTGLADCFSSLGLMLASPREVFPKAKEALTKALEIDDTLCEAHTSLGIVNLFYDWDWLTAEKETQRAIELNPINPESHFLYCFYLLAMGRHADALAEIKKAQELDPLSLTINLMVGWLLYLAGEYDQAIEQYMKLLEMDPNFSSVHGAFARVYMKKQMYGEAIAALQMAHDLSGNSAHLLAVFGHAYAVSGKRKEAQKVLDELIELSLGNEVNIDPADIAIVYSGLGDLDQAFEWLDKAYEYRSANMIWLKVEPVWDNLRSDPRFDDLLRRVGSHSKS
jgi:serine/threonine protein kinase/tetratricopeptide (TPR) repeat protein